MQFICKDIAQLQCGHYSNNSIVLILEKCKIGLLSGQFFLCICVFRLFWIRSLFIFQNNILGWQAATEYEMDEVSFLSDRMPASLSLSRIQRKHHFIEHNAGITTDTTSRDTKPTPTHHSNITLGSFYQSHLSAPRPHNL